MESLPLPPNLEEEEKLEIKKEEPEPELLPLTDYPEVDPAEFLQQVENEQKPKKLKKLIHKTEENEDLTKPLKCTKCDLKTFLTGYELRKHRKYCQPTHFCDICGLKLDSKKELKKHCKMMHKNDNPYQSPKKDVESCTCEHCGKVLANKSSFNKHLKTVHNQYVITPETLVKKCDKCDMEFHEALLMNEHFRSCSKQVIFEVF